MPPQDLWLPPHTCLSRPGPGEEDGWRGGETVCQAENRKEEDERNAGSQGCSNRQGE
ncbi:unnamed protein product, partial [Pleuronectes platessa]